MSHFTVLVVTDTEPTEDGALDKLLAPFDENMEVEPYWVAEDAAFHLKYHAEHGDIPEDASLEDLVAFLNKDDDDGRYRVVDGRLEEETTYNPQSKWDWYTIGGRWQGSLLLKPEADGAGALGEPGEEIHPLTVDSARKGDLDLERQRALAEGRANAVWDIVEHAVAEHGTPKTFDEVQAEHGITDFHAATKEQQNAIRQAYWEQPALVELKAKHVLGMLDGFDELYAGHTRESYVEGARAAAVPGFAFLSEKTGWLEPGRMGWFGMSSDTRDSRSAYYAEVNAFIDALPDDAWLTIVDCHI